MTRLEYKYLPNGVIRTTGIDKPPKGLKMMEKQITFDKIPSNEVALKILNGMILANRFRATQLKSCLKDTLRNIKKGERVVGLKV